MWAPPACERQVSWGMRDFSSHETEFDKDEKLCGAHLPMRGGSHTPSACEIFHHMRPSLPRMKNCPIRP